MLTPGDIVKRIALFFVGGSLVVAVLRGFPVTEPNKWYDWGAEQADAVEVWVTGWMSDVPFNELPPVDPIIPSEGSTPQDGESGSNEKIGTTSKKAESKDSGSNK